MQYRFDLHVHTFFSGDAASSPESIISTARRRGLQGLAFTDHNSCRAIDYCLEKGLMTPDGRAVDDFLVVPGVEVSTADGHLLCIGTTLPDMIGEPAIEVEKAIHARGGIAIPAHPFDKWRAGIRPEILDQLSTTVLEVFNAAVTSRKFNLQAREYAAATNRQMTAASDAHHASAVGTASVSYDLPELTVSALLGAIKGGGELHENYLSRREGLKKHLGNWFRIFNPAPRPPK